MRVASESSPNTSAAVRSVSIPPVSAAVVMNDGDRDTRQPVADVLEGELSPPVARTNPY